MNNFVENRFILPVDWRAALISDEALIERSFVRSTRESF